MRTSNLVGRALVVAAATALSGAVAAVAAQGTSLLVSTSPQSKGVYGELYIGGPQWAGMTSLVTQTFAGRLGSTSSLLDLSAMLAYDALWVDQRYQSAPLAQELDNLVAYAETGRRVVVIGENATWGPWNAAILSALGGAETYTMPPVRAGAAHPNSWLSYPGCAYGAAHTVSQHALVRGVGQINLECAGAAIGGTALFDYNVATLWGPRQNVLTILDANIPDDPFGSALGGRQFRENVVGWLGDSRASVVTPEPSTVALLGAGLLALGGGVRRRIRRDAV